MYKYEKNGNSHTPHHSTSCYLHVKRTQTPTHQSAYEHKSCTNCYRARSIPSTVNASLASTIRIRVWRNYTMNLHCLLSFALYANGNLISLTFVLLRLPLAQPLCYGKLLAICYNFNFTRNYLAYFY